MFSQRASSSDSGRQKLLFALVLALIATVFGVYAANMAGWHESPEYGWRTMYDSGPNVVALLLESGEKAGLRVGDRILAINGKAYSTFDELYFKIRHDEPGSVNAYTISRNGDTRDISITTGKVGLKLVLLRSGPLFAMGFVYALIGVLVFLMKPGAAESWIFLVMTTLIGIHVCYSGPSDLMHPLWLFDVRLFIDIFFPAAIIHLALKFPRERNFLKKRPTLWVVPYLLSLIHFVLYKITIQHYWDPAPTLDLLGNVYLVLAILIFLASMVWNFVTDRSMLIRRQSQVILLGIALGFGIPIIDSVLRFHWQTYLFPDPTLGYVVFLVLFPLSIGYTIVKYDLFAIDILIKRTYGYVLTSGAIAGFYVLFIFLSNLLFGEMTVATSPMFPLVFVLAVVFLFNPVRNRTQRFIDRVFYRLEYDYQQTVRRISEAMRSLLKLDEILRTMLDIALGVMFIDSARVLLLNKERGAYECLAVAGKRELHRTSSGAGMSSGETGSLETIGAVDRRNENTAPTAMMREETDGLHTPGLVLAPENPLIRALAAKKKEVTVYDIESDPLYEQDREACAGVFEGLQATLILPLIYEDRLTGLISLGEKRSGKFYRQEDVNLLTTLANQGAVAIENARLLDEVIEKERMEEELEIARVLQTSMLPAACPVIQGFEIAATSIPAREVGGDFFDFIEMGEDRLGMVIGDVTGKSVSGALIMSASRSVFRMLSEDQRRVDTIMSRANRRLKRDVKSGMFVALLYAVIEFRDRTLRLCSAGQTQPVHFSRKEGNATLIETRGDNFPLGILEDADYQETCLELAAGDRLVFYTDGIVEAMNPQQEMYGFERLMDTVRESRSTTADGLLREILESVNTFVAGATQHDDLTMIVLFVTE